MVYFGGILQYLRHLPSTHSSFLSQCTSSHGSLHRHVSQPYASSLNPVLHFWLQYFLRHADTVNVCIIMRYWFHLMGFTVVVVKINKFSPHRICRLRISRKFLQFTPKHGSCTLLHRQVGHPLESVWNPPLHVYGQKIFRQCGSESVPHKAILLRYILTLFCELVCAYHLMASCQS